MALNTIGVPAHTEFTDAVTETLGTTWDVTDTAIPLLRAVADVTHPKLEVSSTETTSLLLNADVLNTELFIPVFTPLTFHWYEGEGPPFVAVAVNTTDDPAQIDVVDAAIVTAGVTVGVRDTVIELLNAVFDTAQEALEVNSTETTSPLESVELVNEEVFPPVFMPFTFHW